MVTFILYAGKEAWDGPCRLHDMLDFTDIPETLKDLISDYKINVIDIRQFENTEVFKTDVKQVFDFIRCSDDKKKLLDLVQSEAYYKEMDEDAFDVVTKYTNSKELVQVKNYLIEGGKKDVCKAIQDLMADSREKGLEQGINTLVKTLREFHVSEEEITERIMKEFSMTEEKARQYVI